MVRGAQPLLGVLRPTWQAVARPCQGVWAGRRHGRSFVPADRLGGVGQPGRDRAWFFPRKWPGLDRRPLGWRVAERGLDAVAGSGSAPRHRGRGGGVCALHEGGGCRSGAALSYGHRRRLLLPLREGRADLSGSRTDGRPVAQSHGRLSHWEVGSCGRLPCFLSFFARRPVLTPILLDSSTFKR